MMRLVPMCHLACHVIIVCRATAFNIPIHKMPWIHPSPHNTASGSVRVLLRMRQLWRVRSCPHQQVPLRAAACLTSWRGKQIITFHRRRYISAYSIRFLRSWLSQRELSWVSCNNKVYPSRCGFKSFSFLALRGGVERWMIFDFPGWHFVIERKRHEILWGGCAFIYKVRK